MATVITNSNESPKDRVKRYNAAKAQNLLREYGSFIQELIDSTTAEYSAEINETTADEIAMKYKHNQGARDALRLFMKKLNSKAND